MADIRFRFLMQRNDGTYVPQGQTQIAESSQVALRGLNPTGNSRWLALDLDHGTFEHLVATTRTEIDITTADREAAVELNPRPVV